MRFQNALLLACAGSALFVGAVPHDDGTGNAVMSNSGGEDASAVDVKYGAGENTGVDGSGPMPTAMPSGLVGDFRGKGPAGGWGTRLSQRSEEAQGTYPAAGSWSDWLGLAMGKGSKQQQARSLNGHRHSARGSVQNSGPPFNSVWSGSGEVIP